MPTATVFDKRSASLTLLMKRNGIATGNVDRNTARNTTAARWRRQLIQFLAHDFEFHRRQDRCQHRGQRVSDNPMDCTQVGVMAHGAQLCDCRISLDKTTNKVHEAVNDSPRQIAAEGAYE
jgi:hypothetical protein